MSSATPPPPKQPHSPLPWSHEMGLIFSAPTKGGVQLKESECMVAQIRGWGHLSYLGEDVAAAIQEANAGIIVTAVNTHAELVKALHDLLAIIPERGNHFDPEKAAIDRARALLARIPS